MAGCGDDGCGFGEGGGDCGEYCVADGIGVGDERGEILGGLLEKEIGNRE